jgi:hypothetical protein
LCYYPREGEAVAVKLLGRPLYNANLVWDFIRKQLVKERHADGWETLLRDFRQRVGRPAGDSVPFWLSWFYCQTDYHREDVSQEERARARQLIGKFYPDYDFHGSLYINAATLDEQRDLIDVLKRIRSDEIDEGVLRVFRAVVRPERTLVEEKSKLDSVAWACMARLAGKGHDDEFRAFVAQRIREIEEEPLERRGEGLLDELHDLQERLRN